MSPTTQHIISTQSAARIHTYLTTEVADSDEGQAAMRSLKATRPHIFNDVLCLFYDVWCYRVSDSCFADTAPAADQNRFFISVADGFETTVMGEEALSMTYGTYDEATAAAVGSFNLVTAFFAAEPAIA